MSGWFVPLNPVGLFPGGALRPAGDGKLQPADGPAGTAYVLQSSAADPSRPGPEPLPAVPPAAAAGTSERRLVTSQLPDQQTAQQLLCCPKSGGKHQRCLQIQDLFFKKSLFLPV